VEVTGADALDDTELAVLRVTVALVQRAGPSPHVHIREIEQEAGLPEPTVYAA
jgi:hypothetical protein